MATIVDSARLITLGRLALTDGPGHDLLPVESTKLLGILAYLAAAPGRRATRERLIDLFWSDRSHDNARGSLRQAIHRLRDTLGERYLPPGSGDVVLTPALLCDRDEFLASISAGQLDDAVTSYSGAFAPSFLSGGSAGFEQWRDAEQERLHELFAAAAEALARRALESDDPKRASALAARLLTERPLNERAWRLRLQAEQQAGNHVHLAASIAELRRLLASEGWQPEARTLQLLQSLERPQRHESPELDPSRLMTDLVGRAALMSALHERWHQATRRRGAHVHLTGHAGLGKTRVMEDFAVRLRAERARVAMARGLPRQHFVPGAMLASLIAVLCDLPGVNAMSEHSARILLAIQPVIGARFPSATLLDFPDSETRFLAQLEALDDLVGAVSHDAPLCLLLDDVHWWDELSRRTITQLLERLDGRQLLAVTASRPGQGELSLACTSESHALTPLSRDDVLALLQSVGDHPDRERIDRLATGLHGAAEGVPLLVLEAIRLGLDRGLLQLEDQHWCLERLDEFLGILHPGRLLSERLALLSDAQRQVILVAWLAEAPLGTDDAIAIEGGSDSGTLMDLERLGFMTSTNRGWVVAHDTVGEAIEAGATPEQFRRACLVAGTLTMQRGDDLATLRQAAKLFIDADAKEKLHETARVWLRQRRGEGSPVPASDLLRELVGSSLDSAALSAMVRGMPSELRRAPWTARRVAPLWTMVGAVAVAGGWWWSARPAPPDAVLGVLISEANGHATQAQIELREGSWANSDFHLVATPTRQSSDWLAGLSTLNNEPVKDPVRDRWVATRYLPEGDPNGPTELFLNENGSTRPLGSGPGDDVEPSWSPDGRLVVYSTRRWATREDATFHLAILNVDSAVPRQLTAGPNRDYLPFWSPDGTRIAYLRHSTAAATDSLCWIAIDATVQRCRGLPGAHVEGMSGWYDHHSVLLSVARGDSSVISIADVDGGEDRPFGVSTTPLLRISPSGNWIAEEVHTPGRMDIGTRLTLMRSTDPAIKRTVVFAPGQGSLRLFWQEPSSDRGLSALRVGRARDTIPTGIPVALTLAGTDAAGAPMPLAPAVVRWSTSDAGIATVDSVGTVHGQRAGVVTITASAGGWRTASARLVVQDDAVRPLWSEVWDESWPSRWKLWGTPESKVLSAGPSGGHVLFPNGDETFQSGVITKGLFEAKNGLAVDFEISSPITQPRWQFVQVDVRLPGVLAPSGPMGEGCMLRYPAEESWAGREKMMGIPIDSMFRTGQWYQLRVQVFPDGRCGFALNGRALLVTPVRSVPDSMLVAVSGQTVEGKLLFGRVTIRSGVPKDVDWAMRSPIRKTSGPSARR